MLQLPHFSAGAALGHILCCLSELLSKTISQLLIIVFQRQILRRGGKEPGKKEKKEGQYNYIETMEKTLSDTKIQLSIYPLNAIYYI